MCCVFSAPEDFRVNPGAVEAVIQHPAQPQKVSSLAFLSYMQFAASSLGDICDISVMITALVLLWSNLFLVAGSSPVTLHYIT